MEQTTPALSTELLEKLLQPLLHKMSSMGMQFDHISKRLLVLIPALPLDAAAWRTRHILYFFPLH